MLNIEEDETEEQEVTEKRPAEPCRDVETPRKKKKSKKDSDSASTNANIVAISRDSSLSPKKKKKVKDRKGELEEQQEEVILEKKKKKKSKKRKMEQDEMQENLVETPVDPLETRNKRKKMEVGEEQHEVVREEENPASPVETSQKKKKRRRSRSRKKKQEEMEVVQSDELPAGGDRDSGKEPEVTGRKKLDQLQSELSKFYSCFFSSSRWRQCPVLHQPKEKTPQEDAEPSEAAEAPLSREEEQPDVRTQEEVSS